MMKTEELIKEIERLPLDDRMFLIEKAIHSMRIQNEKSKMAKAASSLIREYSKNSELTSFTALDSEEFYETR